MSHTRSELVGLTIIALLVAFVFYCVVWGVFPHGT